MGFFSKEFKIPRQALDDYGAIDISLNCDLPFFIDPCLIYVNEEYSNLHQDIINYFFFLKNNKVELNNYDEFFKYCNFNEIKNTWFGYSKESNKGTGLGPKFAEELFQKIDKLFTFTNCKARIEKIFLFDKTVSCDRISDLTTNLILEFLCTYTQKFVEKYLKDSQRVKTFTIETVRVSNNTYYREKVIYSLPYTKKDEQYILLVPKNIVKVKLNELNINDCINHYRDILPLINEEIHRHNINHLFKQEVEKERQKKTKKKLTEFQHRKIEKNVFQEYIKSHTSIVDSYIQFKNNKSEMDKAKTNNQNEYHEEINKSVNLAFNFLDFFKKNVLASEISLDDFIMQIINYFSFKENGDSKLKYIIKTEKDLKKVLNYISFDIFDKSINKFINGKLFIIFSRNFIKENSSYYKDYMSGNYKIILFCESMEVFNDLLEFLKNKNLQSDLDSKIFVIKYFDLT
ncbi:MAG: hypothetical protein PQJ45_11920 [Sphaerochaetaceae bacterium]|nr:hypothetical protein [Sphaerochaetaceae bacterium]